MNVKELLYNNVRGRVRDILWGEVVKEHDIKETQGGGFANDRDKIQFLYEKAKYWYGVYAPLLKEMENDEKAETQVVDSGCLST